MTDKQSLRSRGVLLAFWLGSAVALSGCQSGFDGVDLQGGVFDVLGISTSSLASKGKEPQVPARAGIVLPPQPDRLPQPGSGAPDDLAQQLPDDVDARKVREATDIDRRHKEFCEKALREARIRGDTTAIIQGPKGACNSSILTTFGQSLNNNQPINSK